MAGYTSESSRLSLRLQVGTDGEGKALYRSMSLGNVDGSASADDVATVVSVLGALLAYPVVRTQKIDTDLVAE